MKIAIDIRDLRHNQLTGIGRFLKLFLDNIDQEYRKNIYLLGDQNTDYSLYNNLYNIIKEKSPFSLWYDQVSIPRIVRENRIDLFFSPYFKMPFFSNCKKIITIHDLHFLERSLRTGMARLKPFITYIRYATRYSNKIITESEFTKKQILKYFNIDESKIKVIYCGLDRKFRILDGSNYSILKSRYNINFKYILYVGNMMPSKNVGGLIGAYNLLSREEKQGYKLIIIAKKDENFRKLQKAVRGFSLENNILFIDFVPDDDLVIFYNFAEAFIFPSFYEGFGFPPLEAMACGTPVISSYTSSLREVLEDNALYIDPYNVEGISRALSKILTDDKLKQIFKEKGIIHSKKYNPMDFSKKLLREIENI